MIKKITALILLSISLQGCLVAVGAAAGVAIAGGVVYDQRTAKASEEDKAINEHVKAALSTIPDIHKNSHIVVATFNGIVLLTGQAPSKKIKDEATQTALTVPGIKRLYNEIEISGNPSSLTTVSDSWITAKIKSSLIAKKDFASSMIQVVTNNGNVYLLGVVTHEQGDEAVEVAQHVSGVQKVVKLFEYKKPDVSE